MVTLKLEFNCNLVTFYHTMHSTEVSQHSVPMEK